MGILKKIARSFVYHYTEKPLHYVHVDKPKTLQECRQVQYNNWCKAKGVYNGSYLPKNPNKLKATGKKGWIEITSPYDKTGTHRTFQRKSSGQVVDYHCKAPTKRGTIADEHYHWWEVFSFEEQPRKPKHTNYRDRYGNVCNKGSRESHLAPLDKKYDFK